MDVGAFLESGERRDEKLNFQLANSIVVGKDEDAVNSLFIALKTGTVCKKYKIWRLVASIAKIEPVLIAPYAEILIENMDSKYTNIQSTCMAILWYILPIRPVFIWEHIEVLQYAGESGAVVARDYLVKILVQLGSNDRYYEASIHLLLQWLRDAPENQMATYAEQAFSIMKAADRSAFATILSHRIMHTQAITKMKRLQTLLHLVIRQMD